MVMEYVSKCVCVNALHHHFQTTDGKLKRKIACINQMASCL